MLNELRKSYNFMKKGNWDVVDDFTLSMMVESIEENFYMMEESLTSKEYDEAKKMVDEIKAYARKRG